LFENLSIKTTSYKQIIPSSEQTIKKQHLLFIFTFDFSRFKQEQIFIVIDELRIKNIIIAKIKFLIHAYWQR